jgi:hypothetical protein
MQQQRCPDIIFREIFRVVRFRVFQHNLPKAEVA